jgi:DNA-directed RNA polymerase subunit RPC12/RpoP
MDGLGVAHWRCTDCRRRFVLAHESPQGFTPVYLDPGVRSIDPRDTGTGGSASGSAHALPAPPPAIDFQCRCGEKITAHSWMYGGTAVCPKCRSTIYLALKYSVKKKVHVIVPEYPHTTNSA